MVPGRSPSRRSARLLVSLFVLAPHLTSATSTTSNANNNAEHPPRSLDSVAGVAGLPSRLLLDSLEPLALRDLATEALKRNPGVARARYHAAAAASRAPQDRSLPDPVAAMSLFVLPPETRVGPQLLSASLQQTFPWFGKLALRERAAALHAAAAEARVETERLDLLTEVRRLFYELAFLEAQSEIQTDERDTLVRFERAAQARYAAGTGLQQEIVRIQAQITSASTGLLETRQRRASLLAALNTLRDRSYDTEVRGLELPPLTDSPPLPSERALSLDRALLLRPEIAELDARIAALESLVELAEKNRRPDVTLGLSYTLVENRDDETGRIDPPRDNGDDILALTGSLNLPVRKRKLEAQVAEARARQFGAEEERRELLASIEGTTGELWARLPLLVDHFRLLDGVLGVQAGEARRSAETAYSTGKLNAVDLLDAEVVLLEVEIAKARTRADWSIHRARLERALAYPINTSPVTTSAIDLEPSR